MNEIIKPKFHYWEIVRVKRRDDFVKSTLPENMQRVIDFDDTPQIYGAVGYITYISEFHFDPITNTEEFSYSIQFLSMDDDWIFAEDELESLGGFFYMGVPLVGPKFKHKEIVKIKSQEEIKKITPAYYKDQLEFDAQFPERFGSTGYIVAFGAPERGGSYVWSYSIQSLTDDYDSNFANEYELESTGQFQPQEEIEKRHKRMYDGSSLKVTPQGKVTEIDIKDHTWQQKTGNSSKEDQK